MPSKYLTHTHLKAIIIGLISSIALCTLLMLAGHLRGNISASFTSCFVIPLKTFLMFPIAFVVLFITSLSALLPTGETTLHEVFGMWLVWVVCLGSVIFSLRPSFYARHPRTSLTLLGGAIFVICSTTMLVMIALSEA